MTYNERGFFSFICEGQYGQSLFIKTTTGVGQYCGGW
jgi:hypothetical protein